MWEVGSQRRTNSVEQVAVPQAAMLPLQGQLPQQTRPWPPSNQCRDGHLLPRSCTAHADGCISSANYPQNYPSHDECGIRVAPNILKDIRVVAFSTEGQYDKMIVDGDPYSGNRGPERVVPHGTIIWSAVFWLQYAKTPTFFVLARPRELE